MIAPWVYLLEMPGYTDTTTSTMYRFGSLGYNTEPTDMPPNTHYEDRLIGAGNIVRRLSQSGASPLLGQRVQVSYGIIRLRNNDGALDTIFSRADISFRERPATLLRVRDGMPYSTAQVVLVVAVSEVVRGRDEIEIHVKDRLYELASPHITAVYGGTNVLPNGVDGGADLAGKRLPLCLGKCLQVQPDCVNTSKQIYRVSSAAIQSMTVYSGGLAVTAGTNYTSQADMEANAPLSGQVRVWPAGGMFRWGGAAPTYVLTADVVADTTANSKAGTLIKRLVEARGLTINAADVAALDAANGAVLQVFVNDDRDTLAIMEEVARTVGAAFWANRLGVVRLARVALPTGAAPRATIADWSALRVTSVPTTEDVPTTKWTLQYARYHRPLQGPDVATSVSDSDRADLGQAWRVATDSVTLTPNPHKRTEEGKRDTAFTAKADADAEATRLVGITDEPLYTHLIEGSQLDDEVLFDLDLDDEITLRWDRYGFDPETEIPRRVTGLTVDYQFGKCDLIVWGTEAWNT